jgi:hypothetical protein
MEIGIKDKIVNQAGGIVVSDEIKISNDIQFVKA